MCVLASFYWISNFYMYIVSAKCVSMYSVLMLKHKFKLFRYPFNGIRTNTQFSSLRKNEKRTQQRKKKIWLKNVNAKKMPYFQCVYFNIHFVTFQFRVQNQIISITLTHTQTEYIAQIDKENVEEKHISTTKTNTRLKCLFVFSIFSMHIISFIRCFSRCFFPDK